MHGKGLEETESKYFHDDTENQEIEETLRGIAAGVQLHAPTMKEMRGLVGLDPLWDLMQIIIWSGRVAGEKPISAIIVSEPGSGKTSLIEKLHCEPFTSYTDDLTSRELSKILNRDKYATHILLGDMMAVFTHKASVVGLTCNVLRRCVEEGIETDSFTGATVAVGPDGQRRHLGLITAIPRDDFQGIRVKRQMREGGFGARFLVIRYHYLPETREKIHDFIQSDAYTKGLKPDAPGLIKIPHPVEIPEFLAKQIRHLSMGMRRSNDTDQLGARWHHHLRALVKAAAIQSDRGVANQEDLGRILYHADFFGDRGKWL